MTLLDIADSGTWSLGVIVGAPVAVVSVAALTATGIWLWRKNRELPEGNIDKGILKAFGIGSLVSAVVVAVISAWCLYPPSAEYHQWRNVSGTVQQIDKRLIGTGKSMEDKFVVRFADSGQQFGCDDTRCASVREGDDLTLSCKRAWQYTGTDGYDCRFVSTEAAR